MSSIESLKKYVFETYRYQILPISKNIQKKIDSNIETYEQLVAEKNNLLADILLNKNIFLNYKRSQVVFRLEYSDKNIFIFRLGVRRDIKRNTKEFKQEEIEDYPNIVLIFNNDPTVQKLAIQKNYRAFNKSETVAHLIENSLSNFLLGLNLAIYIEPIYNVSEFWDIIERYPNKIQQIGFELIRPNLSNISNTIDKQIKQLQLSTDAHKTKFELESNKDANLNITQDNQQIQNLLEYSAQGGGPISLKIKGLKKKIKTKKSSEEFEITELELNGPPEQLKEMMKDILK
ncbi:MAG: hypothetical protein IPM51_10560 [Sphingobacteriaceae bacterium]|nr:hypothetical protein [Sphingobacteriaceae bacterium]